MLKNRENRQSAEFGDIAIQNELYEIVQKYLFDTTLSQHESEFGIALNGTSNADEATEGGLG